jgi:hypothetical protein
VQGHWAPDGSQHNEGLCGQRAGSGAGCGALCNPVRPCASMCNPVHPCASLWGQAHLPGPHAPTLCISPCELLCSCQHC